MAQQVTNFGRFYTAIRALNPIGDRDDVKKSIVYQYTNGRTDSLREMSRTEYDKCCEDLERKTRQKDELRKERSATLKLMQKMGVDTTDWNRVNLLCRDTRIIGKDFYYITAEEHRELRRKLRSIERKGGINRKPASMPEPQPQQKTTASVRGSHRTDGPDIQLINLIIHTSWQKDRKKPLSPASARKQPKKPLQPTPRQTQNVRKSQPKSS